jgi:hypothetical protein
LIDHNQRPETRHKYLLQRGTHEENGFAERYLSRQSGGEIFPDADVQPSNKIQQAWPALPTHARTEPIRLRHGLQKARAIVADGIVLACSQLPDKRLQGGRLLSVSPRKLLMRADSYRPARQSG